MCQKIYLSQADRVFKPALLPLVLLDFSTMEQHSDVHFDIRSLLRNDLDQVCPRASVETSGDKSRMLRY